MHLATAVSQYSTVQLQGKHEEAIRKYNKVRLLCCPAETVLSFFCSSSIVIMSQPSPLIQQSLLARCSMHVLHAKRALSSSESIVRRQT